jgi:hypothetical protein
MSTRLDRRAFLRSLGAGAAALSFAPLFEARAANATTPRRLVFFFSSNGTIRESFLPKMVSGKLELSPILAPLEKHKSKLLVLDGLCHKVILEKSSRSGHTAGMNTALTGRNNDILDPSQPLRSLAMGISLDQYLAGKIGAGTKLRSIECGVQVEPYSKDFAALSYRGPRQPILAENSPYRIFDRLFGHFSNPDSHDSPAESEAAREALLDRQRVLAAVAVDLEALRKKLPAADRVKIEQSLTVSASSASAHACKKPNLGKPIDIWKNDNIPAIAKLHMDLMVMALACDLTRIGTLQFGRGGAGHRFTWLGKEFASDPQVGPICQAKGLHALAHRETDAKSRAKLVKANAWYASQLAYLLEKLESIPEAGGTMLDNTIVVWLNELGTGGDHRHDQLPFVIAGNAGGFFRTGQLASFPDEPHNRLLLSLCHALGVDTDQFGDPDYCRAGALTGVTKV